MPGSAVRDSERPALHTRATRGIRVPTGAGEYLAIGRGGWALWYSQGEHDVRLRLIRVPSGRLNFVAVLIQSRGYAEPDSDDRRPVIAPELRHVPLGRLESIVNASDLRHAITSYVEAAGPGAFDPKVHPSTAIAAASRLPINQEQPNLKVDPAPPGRDKGDAFYKSIAIAFGQAQRVSKTPAVDLAKANDVPISTINRWVRVARKRGLIPPAH